MLKIIAKILFAGGLTLCLAGGSLGDVIPTSKWTAFYGSTTTYNGAPIPIGSIIDAYDPDGVHCGRDTVIMAGHYGFMPVYGRDDYGDGAEQGEVITFYVNNRLAIPNGPDDPVWLGMDYRLEVNLSASASVSMAVVSLPDDQDASPGDVVRYYVTVQNTAIIDGGLDFYTVSGSSTHAWTVDPISDFVHALPGENATLYFDVIVPMAIFYDLDEEVKFKVASGTDPSVFVEGSVVTHVKIATDAPEDDDGLLPDGFNLHQNYPNPFNPKTTIAFDLAVKAGVELEVYNVLGNRIAVFDLGPLDAGRHTFDFDGGSLASGIYFYRIEAADFAAVRKMVLMK